VLHPWEGAPDTHLIGGWVGPRDDLDVVAKRKVPALTGNQMFIIQPICLSL